MEIGSREVGGVSGRIAMLAISHVARGNSRKGRILEVSAAKAVERRCEARDHRGEDDTTWPTHAARLGEGLQAVALLRQVVQRAEEKHGIGTRVRERNRACVAHLGARERRVGAGVGSGARLLDVKRY